MNEHKLSFDYSSIIKWNADLEDLSRVHRLDVQRNSSMLGDISHIIVNQKTKLSDMVQRQVFTTQESS